MELIILWIFTGFLSWMYDCFWKKQLIFSNMFVCLLTGPYILIKLTCKDDYEDEDGL